MSGWKTSPAPGTPPDDAQSRSFARGHGTQRRVPEPGPTTVFAHATASDRGGDGHVRGVCGICLCTLSWRPGADKCVAS